MMFCCGIDTTGGILGAGGVVPARTTATETPRLQSAKGKGAAESPCSPPPWEVLVRLEQMDAGELNRKDTCGRIRQLLGWRGHRGEDGNPEHGGPRWPERRDPNRKACSGTSERQAASRTAPQVTVSHPGQRRAAPCWKPSYSIWGVSAAPMDLAGAARRHLRHPPDAH